MNLIEAPVEGIEVADAGVVIGLRPESLEIAPDGIAARVEVVEELGADAYAFCAADVGRGEQRLIARADYRNPPRQGELVKLRPRAGEAHLFDAASGRADQHEAKGRRRRS